ncbi:TonB-dependent receptor [Flavisphingomonas formosensis]|uniref:TonB-dependent receptor n=1 Tax=Flavisphingomonas formosensis TaxID=861534 RepID=UPI0012FB6CC8|nr:TonB-dependent receptor [Sphingomonas formosensis]
MRSFGKTAFTALLASTGLATAAPAFAQDQQAAAAPADAPAYGEIIVTATKRSESLQKVPISIQALGTETLAQHQVASFDDYAKLLPSVSFQSFGPGQSQLYFRGVTSGGDGLHGGSAPATGLYLDEIPLTTIANNVDLHVYDVARVEALSGPQGTLYGASSLSGTLRIITNKPDASKFEAGIDLQGNKFGKGAAGGTVEGFVNIPLSSNAAIRLVGFYEHDGGYIDNTYKQRNFDVNGDGVTDVSVNNKALVKKNFNDVDTYGGRAALKVDLDDNWSVTPMVVGQYQKAHGNFLYDPKAGDLKVHDFIPEYNKDRWVQAALTVQGKLSDWDVTYAGGYFVRKVDNVTDYSYYTVDYAVPSGYGNFPLKDGSGYLDPTQNQFLHDKYTKMSHELRVSSPADQPLRITAGMFYQRQTDKIAADYRVAGISTLTDLDPDVTFPTPIPGFGDSVFRTRLMRKDKDAAAFTEVSYDILPNLTVLGGVRVFATKTTLYGFSGFAFNIDSTCINDGATNRPCTNVDKHQNETGETHKANLTWKITPDKMVYFTYSTGFRPGGVNRRQGVVPFKSDTLTNYEIGWKTTWFDRRLRVNGAVFLEDWKDVQFGLSPIGSQGVTNTYNAGDARIKGIEGDFSLTLGGLVLSGSGTYVDAKLTSPFCAFDDLGNSVCLPGVAPAAPKGTRLPVQPKFKGNINARYNMKFGDIDAYVQGTALHQGGTRTFLTDEEFSIIGPTKGFTTFDFALGGSLNKTSFELFIQNAFDKRGQLSRNTACAPAYCGGDYRIYPVKPQLFGVKLGQRF